MTTIKKTTVKNLLTGKKSIYINNQSLADNIVNEIILIKNQTAQLLDQSTRDKYKKIVIESESKLTGRKFAYCIDFNLHASTSKN